MDELWRRETFNKYLELRGREEDEAVYARLSDAKIIANRGKPAAAAQLAGQWDEADNGLQTQTRTRIQGGLTCTKKYR